MSDSANDVPDVIPLRAPRLRFALYTRGAGGQWCEADYCETEDEAMAYAYDAIQSGESVMIEPCDPWPLKGA